MHWVFAYGSLIYKIDFPYVERREASIFGWQRRFWQGSHDHRGTPEAPGRVVTLVEVPGSRCYGIAYKVEEKVFEHLDYREKNGYSRLEIEIDLTGFSGVTGTVYVADEQNPAFLGESSAEEIAQHIAGSSGPSGSNADYLLQLAAALRELAIEDEHVFELERLFMKSYSKRAN